MHGIFIKVSRSQDAMNKILLKSIHEMHIIETSID